jgi:predicted DNA-binding ribbon-helix-helix protein
VANEMGVASVTLNRQHWQIFVNIARNENPWLPPGIDDIDDLRYGGYYRLFMVLNCCMQV